MMPQLCYGYIGYNTNNIKYILQKEKVKPFFGKKKKFPVSMGAIAFLIDKNSRLKYSNGDVI